MNIKIKVIHLSMLDLRYKLDKICAKFNKKLKRINILI